MFHILVSPVYVEASISSILKFSLEVSGEGFFKGEVMLQEGFIINS